MKAAPLHDIVLARGKGTPVTVNSFTALAFDGIKVIARPERPIPSNLAKTRPVLLVSEDVALGNALCLAAAGNALTVMRTLSFREEEANQVRPAAILLDLDLSSEAGWEAAEWYLSRETEAPVLMLTARADQHELGAAVRVGIVYEKSIGAARLLRVLELALQESRPQTQARMALQQAWLRRAKPYRWRCSALIDHRHWGINE